MSAAAPPLGWLGIARLGLVQSALGSILVLMTSTLNRVMVVELALPALLPGFLLGLYHVVQLARPRLGHGSDVGGRRTPWIVGGMALLAIGAVSAAIATAIFPDHRLIALPLAIAAFLAVGLGVGAAGTSLLVVLAKRVPARRRAAAAMLAWIMMIAGSIVTAGVAGHFLEPFSLMRLVAVTSIVSAISFVLACLAVRGVEPAAGTTTRTTHAVSSGGSDARPSFRRALAQVWAEIEARRFTVFVFVSMLAYSAQDLVLEPFAGTLFGYSPGQSTQLAALQNTGTLLGMLTLGVLGSLRAGSTRLLATWAAAGCIASALALAALACGATLAVDWPLRANVFALGVANGVFAVAAIGSMMTLAGAGAQGREGVRMGLWGAAQALAFAAGGVLATGLVDAVRATSGSTVTAYAIVFSVQALLFAVSARLAWRVGVRRSEPGVDASMTLPWRASMERT
jgi:BCD family chlorophyll transporter-like MFS transporter